MPSGSLEFTKKNKQNGMERAKIEAIVFRALKFEEGFLEEQAL